MLCTVSLYHIYHNYGCASKMSQDLPFKKILKNAVEKTYYNLYDNEQIMLPELIMNSNN